MDNSGKHIHNEKCIPYDKMNPLQQWLHREGCSSIFGLQHKLLTQKRQAEKLQNQSAQDNQHGTK